MKVLLVGEGGREHALGWKIAASPEVAQVVCAPGNAGLELEPKVICEPVASANVSGLVDLARRIKPDLVVVGPETPLVLGLADRLSALGFPTVGPTREGAMLEGSKGFAKEIMQRLGIPSASFAVFSDLGQALRYLQGLHGPCVVKADGLAAGKGVVICQTREEATRAVEQMLGERAFGEAGSRVVIEEFLEGEEASCIALTDGQEILMLASSQDHKRVFDGDEGPNTGGMGAYSPAPIMTPALEAQVMEQVFRPLVRGLASQGILFRGILYAGLMIGPAGPKVLEWNVRMGDPETQPLLLRLQSDLVPSLLAVANGRLSSTPLRWDPRPSVCVVMASGGYPGAYQKGKPIDGLLAAAALPDVKVFHGGTRREGERVVTSGGRVLGVCALGQDIRAAVQGAYAAVDQIRFAGAHVRRDIAHRALQRQGG